MLWILWRLVERSSTNMYEYCEIEWIWSKTVDEYISEDIREIVGRESDWIDDW